MKTLTSDEFYNQNIRPTLVDKAYLPAAHILDFAERYAQYMCEQQRIICAEQAKVKYSSGRIGVKAKVDKDSILNAPLATLKTD